MDTEVLTGSRWILLPGTLCTASVFDRFLDALGVGRQNRVALPLSKPAIDDYQHVFKNNVRPGDIVCGFSLGAIVAAHHAQVLERAGALILFGINPYKDDPAKAPERIALQNDVQKCGGRSALLARLPALNGLGPDEALECVLTMADQSAENIGAQTALALSRPGALDSIRACRVPVHVLAGDRDEQAPPQFASTVADAAPIGRFSMLAGLGHYALLEDPAACARAVKASL